MYQHTKRHLQKEKKICLVDDKCIFSFLDLNQFLILNTWPHLRIAHVLEFKVSRRDVSRFEPLHDGDGVGVRTDAAEAGLDRVVATADDRGHLGIFEYLNIFKSYAGSDHLWARFWTRLFSPNFDLTVFYCNF